jgi:DNA-directed RNA polymerase II subunit RPB7
MFFLKYLEREISIHPSFFGREMEDRLRERLFADMEGSCNGEYYIICVIDIFNISPGRVKAGRGEANFTISYRAILWKPFKGETVSAMVQW